MAGWFGRAASLPLRRYQYVLPLWLVLPLSLAAHLAVGLILYKLPEGAGEVGLPVYQVRIIQVPAPPRIRRAPISREALGRLNVEAPTFRPPRAEELVAPELEAPVAEEATIASDRSGPLPPPVVEAPPAETLVAPDLPRREEARATPPPRDGLASSPEETVAARPPPPGPPVPTALPPPLTPTPPRPPPLPRELDLDEAIARVAPRLPEKPPAGEETPATPLDQLRERIAARPPTPEEGAPPPDRPKAPALPPPEASPSTGASKERFRADPLAALALRRYRSHIQGRVKDNYNYPADFPCGIVSEVRLTIATSGKILGYELLRSSGNERFDYAVELSIRRTILDPPAREIDQEVIRPRLRFKSKQCPTENP